jgi:hypothetical protein
MHRVVVGKFVIVEDKFVIVEEKPAQSLEALIIGRGELTHGFC